MPNGSCVSPSHTPPQSTASQPPKPAWRPLSSQGPATWEGTNNLVRLRMLIINTFKFDQPTGPRSVSGPLQPAPGRPPHSQQASWVPSPATTVPARQLETRATTPPLQPRSSGSRPPHRPNRPLCSRPGQLKACRCCLLKHPQATSPLGPE